MTQGMRYEESFKELAVAEALSTRDVHKVAKDLGVSIGALYKWIQKSKKESVSKGKQDLIEKFLDLIEANYVDLDLNCDENYSEQKTEHFLRLCMSGITGFKCYYKERLKEDKNDSNKERLKFLKKFCYLLYELED